MRSKTPPGLDPEYVRRREAREQHRREVESLIGFSRKPARAWSRGAARRAAIRRAGRLQGPSP